MSISNGQTITSSDLLSMSASAITTLGSLENVPRQQVQHNLFFPNVISTTAARNSRADFVMPDDYLLSDVAFAAGSTTGDLTLTIDNGALIETITLTATGDGSYDKFTRYYSTGATASGKPQQVFLKGSVVTVTVANTDTTAGPHSINVSLIFNGWPRRF